MTPEGEQILAYVSHATGLIAVLALYVGSLGFPFEKQTWKGQSQPERSHRLRQRVLQWIGLPCVFITVGCQFAITTLF